MAKFEFGLFHFFHSGVISLFILGHILQFSPQFSKPYTVLSNDHLLCSFQLKMFKFLKIEQMLST